MNEPNATLETNMVLVRSSLTQLGLGSPPLPFFEGPRQPPFFKFSPVSPFGLRLKINPPFSKGVLAVSLESLNLERDLALSNDFSFRNKAPQGFNNCPYMVNTWKYFLSIFVTVPRTNITVSIIFDTHSATREHPLKSAIYSRCSRLTCLSKSIRLPHCFKLKLYSLLAFLFHLV